ncbi:winged helix-turn-helix domain-containing protein [Arsukibacterium sp.]|uniref:winged helix-turn-helix domain-containing protein n=1 Tax=Arsukibacterium sp. TaxID=1977258 RepID=UPI0035672850
MEQWIVNTNENTLHDSQNLNTHQLEPQTMAVLKLLLENAEEIVLREAFFEQVWGKKVVLDENLSRCISQLRKAFGDNARSPVFIKTVHKTGYKFLITPLPLVPDIKPQNKAEAELLAVSDWQPPSKYGVSAFTSFFFVIVCVCVFLLGFFGSNIKLDNESATSGYLDDAESARIRQLLLDSQNNEIFITLASPLDDNHQFEVSLKGNEIGTENSATTFVIQDHSQETLWELDRRLNTAEERMSAVNDVMLILNAIAMSYKYSAPGSISLPSFKKYQQAMYRLDKRGADNLETAIRLFDEVLNDSPDFVEATIYKAVAIRTLNYYRLDLENRDQRVLQYDLLLKQAAALDPKHPVVRALTANFDIKRKNWIEYESTLVAAVQGAPDCFVCVRALADFYVNLGLFQRAAQVIETHIDNFPLSRQMHTLLGEIYTRQGNVPGAKQQADILKALGSEEASDLLGLKFNIYSLHGDVDKVTVLLNQFLEIYPNFDSLKVAYDALLVHDLEAATAAVEQLPRLHFNLALSVGKVDAVFQRLVDNVSSGNLIDLGLMHGWLNEPTEVNRYYAEQLVALKNHPDMPAFLERIGLIDYWVKTERWPDYCVDKRYINLRADFCELSFVAQKLAKTKS